MKPISGGAYEEAYKQAVPIVMAGKATMSNADWRDAYRLVKNAVGNESGFGEYDVLPDKPGRIEKDMFNKSLKAAQGTGKGP
jgi:hypothetical protein